MGGHRARRGIDQRRTCHHQPVQRRVTGGGTGSSTSSVVDSDAAGSSCAWAPVDPDRLARCAPRVGGGIALSVTTAAPAPYVSGASVVDITLTSNGTSISSSSSRALIAESSNRARLEFTPSLAESDCNAPASPHPHPARLALVLGACSSDDSSSSSGSEGANGHDDRGGRHHQRGVGHAGASAGGIHGGQASRRRLCQGAAARLAGLRPRRSRCRRDHRGPHAGEPQPRERRGRRREAARATRRACCTRPTPAIRASSSRT